MDQSIVTILALEMLFVNLVIAVTCSKKKYSAVITWLSFFIFTLVFMVLFRTVLSNLPIYGNGNGALMLTGFLYIIPFYLLFDQTVRFTLIIMGTSWIYTMLVFVLSYRIGYLFPENSFHPATLFFQTVFYLITFPVLLSFIKSKFLFILKNIESHMMNTLLALSLLWFFLLYFINYLFVQGYSFALGLIIILLIAGNTILSYRLFFSHILMNNTAKSLDQRTKIDPLTKLKNREGLYQDTAEFITNFQPFTIIFIDLDDFKSVNDIYGHEVGDAYLIDFANHIRSEFKEILGLYRMSGDEFVILCTSNDLNKVISRLLETNFEMKKSKVLFRGISSGYALFPHDGKQMSELLHKADVKMYQVKKMKHRNPKNFS
ncbi:MAG TPA: GGDEF domain-containing protein [Anaerolineaceae bacterium]|nr:GGDEF domain-containing protein [Anaerolineaceae bacterium]